MTTRSSTGIPAALFSVPVTEADVRRLAGQAAYSWADMWQRDGHISETILGKQVLRARVHGVWRRVDVATVRAYGRQIESECTCGVHARGTHVCRHAAAILLQWVRGRDVFIAVDEATIISDVLDEIEPLAGAEAVSTEPTSSALGASVETQLEVLLDRYSMQVLREVGRKRNASVTGKNKSELVRNLARVLSTPHNVDAALADLDDDERIALAAMDLAGGRYGAAATAIGRAYSALGGKGTSLAHVPLAFDALVDLALAIPRDFYGHPSFDYTLPTAVGARLQPSPELLRLAGGREQSSTATAEPVMSGPAGTEAPDPATARLDLLQVLLVIVYELLWNRVGTQLQQVDEREVRGVAPGWRINDHALVANRAAHVRLAPLPPMLPVADLTHLVELTGQSVTMLDFALRLMLKLGLMEEGTESGVARLVSHPERMQTLLAASPQSRLDNLLAAWLALPDSTELRSIAGPRKPLVLAYQSAYNWGGLTQPHGSTARHLIANIVGRLSLAETDSVYDLSSVLELLWNVGRDALSARGMEAQQWWLSHESSPERKMNLSEQPDWLLVWRPMLSAMVSGPMTWLGLVEPVGADGEITGFRVLPPARRLVFRELPLVSQSAGHGILFEEEDASPSEGHRHLVSGWQEPETGWPACSIVVVPTDVSDASVHDMLLRIAAPVGASARGMRYRLRVDGILNTFESGWSAQDLIHWLSEHAAAAVPQNLCETIDRLGEEFGRVRLYDDVAIIELADDFLTQELLTRPSLRDAVLQPLGPRLLAVHPARVDEMLAELTRLGHTPRVLEERITA